MKILNGRQPLSNEAQRCTTKHNTLYAFKYDVVSDLMNNVVAMCYQNSDASQDAPKDFIDS